MLMITDIILCMFIDLIQISSTVSFLCYPDLDFFVQGHLIILVNQFALIHINDYRHYT